MEETSIDWLLTGMGAWFPVLCGVVSMLLPKLLPSWRRFICRITAVALNACCERILFLVMIHVICYIYSKLPSNERQKKLLTLHLALAKFFFIWRLTDSWMFLQRAVSPAILKTQNTKTSVRCVILLWYIHFAQFLPITEEIHTLLGSIRLSCSKTFSALNMILLL